MERVNKTIRLISVDWPKDGQAGSVVYELSDGSGVSRSEVFFMEGYPRELFGVPVWGWDGDRADLTLRPSVYCKSVFGLAHFYIKAGKIETCLDSELNGVEVKWTEF